MAKKGLGQRQESPLWDGVLEDGMNSDETALRIAIMWYGASMLPILRRKTKEEISSLLKEVQEISGEHPVHLIREEKFVCPSFSKDKKLSGGQVMALMVFGLYVVLGERDELAGGLIDNWPEIKQAKLLVDGGKT